MRYFEPSWSGVRVAEGARLEIAWAGSTCLEGSNPSHSVPVGVVSAGAQRTSASIPARSRAYSSAGERPLHTREVLGSIPSTPIGRTLAGIGACRVVRAVAAGPAPAYARPVGDPRALLDRLSAAQNAHDVEGMLAYFHEDYRSEQPLFPARAFQGIAQVRANWSALLGAIPDFHAEILCTAVAGDVVFAEIRWTGTKANGTPLEERGVMIVGVRDDRIAWARFYADEVERESADIDAVVRGMAGTEDR